MNEYLSQSKSATPKDMANILMRKHGIGSVVTSPEANQPEPMPTEGPYEGKRVELHGRTYEYAKAPTHKMVWNRETGQMEPGFYSLRTYFSHSTDGIGPGPGWDLRLELSGLSEEEMTERYGHVFTREEIFSPSGTRELNGSLVGGMPDDIPYYDIVPLDNEVAS